MLNLSLQDDTQLLELIVADANRAESVYQPGPYWAGKCKSAVRGLELFGLSDFRGDSNDIATSYADNFFVDVRLSYNHGLRSLLSYTHSKIYPFNRIFSSQVSITKGYAAELIKYQNEFLKSHPRIIHLLRKYNIDFDTTRGGCKSYLEVSDRRLSHHYLQLLSTIDYISEDIPFNSATRFMEIGGGFGANVHLLVELFKVRKIIYLDIAPNLYVGTQYLKSFYGQSVFDYRSCRKTKIKFRDNQDLEIYCILPSQIETLKVELDVFHNAHSFVEMPESVVENYASNLKKLLSKKTGHVSLVSYDGFDLATTFNPKILSSFFNGNVVERTVDTLRLGRRYFHFLIRL